jgi:hypothetical protein
MSQFGKINLKQLGVSALGAVAVAVIQALNTAVAGGSFNPFSFDYASLGALALKTFVGFVLAHLLTDSNGNPLGLGK